MKDISAKVENKGIAFSFHCF